MRGSTVADVTLSCHLSPSPLVQWPGWLAAFTPNGQDQDRESLQGSLVVFTCFHTLRSPQPISSDTLTQTDQSVLRPRWNNIIMLPRNGPTVHCLARVFAKRGKDLAVAPGRALLRAQSPHHLISNFMEREGDTKYIMLISYN